MQAVYEIAEEFDLKVVEDCAHALGVQWDGVQAGRSADVACFSTQAAKGARTTPRTPRRRPPDLCSTLPT
eukprot:2019243-Prymnesium_polylepis.2